METRHMRSPAFLLLLQMVPLLVVPSGASQCDPHLFPDSGPFFEGWYIRISDFPQNRSMALIVGNMIPAQVTPGAKLAYVTALLAQDGGNLTGYDHFPDPATIFIQSHGRPVTSDPDFGSPVHFSWGSKSIGNLVVRSNATTFSFFVGHVHFEAILGSALPWGPDGLGPMSWLSRLEAIIPLSWFVCSTRSEVITYTWTDTKRGITLSGNGGLAHVEKNWGRTFPEAWIWSQGFLGHDGVSIALSYGPVNFHGVTLMGHLLGYRDPTKDLSVDFDPTNSVCSVSTIDGCAGVVQMDITGWRHKITLTLRASERSFSDCLYGPTTNGFEPVCKESFSGSASVAIYRRNFFTYEMIEERVFESLLALEFGGDYVCHKECT